MRKYTRSVRAGGKEATEVWNLVLRKIMREAAMRWLGVDQFPRKHRVLSIVPEFTAQNLECTAVRQEPLVPHKLASRAIEDENGRRRAAPVSFLRL